MPFPPFQRLPSAVSPQPPLLPLPYLLQDCPAFHLLPCPKHCLSEHYQDPVPTSGTAESIVTSKTQKRTPQTWAAALDLSTQIQIDYSFCGKRDTYMFTYMQIIWESCWNADSDSWLWPEIRHFYKLPRMLPVSYDPWPHTLSYLGLWTSLQGRHTAYILQMRNGLRG